MDKSKIILATASPQRIELFLSLNFDFETHESKIDETTYNNFKTSIRVQKIAQAKVEALSKSKKFKNDNYIFVGADTLVCLKLNLDSYYSLKKNIDQLDNKNHTIIKSNRQNKSYYELSFGKARDKNEAHNIIKILEGKKHWVYTGVYVSNKNFKKRILSKNQVQLSNFNKKEIEEYVERKDWIGAAGAYKIQGEAKKYLLSINGSLTGIMGLPLPELYGILRTIV